jgi:hypothetical protein
VIVSKEPNYSSAMDLHSFHLSYQPAPRFIDGWVNLWHDGDKHLATVEVESVPT